MHCIAPLVLCRCCKDGQFEQAVGVALEGRRLDKLEEVVGRSTNAAATLAYALRVCQQLVINRDFRQQVCSGRRPLYVAREMHGCVPELQLSSCVQGAVADR
jgi:hypothetical protein